MCSSESAARAACHAGGQAALQFPLLDRRRTPVLLAYEICLLALLLAWSKTHPGARLPAHLVVCLHAQNPETHIAAGTRASRADQVSEWTCQWATTKLATHSSPA
jgi:hypothetical protein